MSAVSADTTLVTLTIGANDIGRANLAATCFNLLPQPLGTSCEAKATVDGVDRGDQAVGSVAPHLAQTLDAIHVKASHRPHPHHQLRQHVQHDGCCPVQPMWPQDANYIQGLVDQLGRVTAAVAAQHHAAYVDFIRPGIGYNGCQLTQNWVNVLVVSEVGLAALVETNSRLGCLLTVIGL